MTDEPTMRSTPSLYDAACRLGEEIHDGKWNHIAGLAVKPAPACEEIIEELARPPLAKERSLYGSNRPQLGRLTKDDLHSTKVA